MQPGAFEQANEIDDGNNQILPVSEEKILEREGQVWESMKEEYFNVIDQLPSSLQRQMSLMKELDQQVHSHRDQLLLLLRNYIHSRRSHIFPIPHQGDPSISSTSPTTLSNKDMLSRIACLSDEILRTSEEKVHLAKSSSDSVERYIRLLDFAIREQEAAISAGADSGAPPIVLPELNVPITRLGVIRSTSSPFQDSDDEDKDADPSPAAVTTLEGQPLLEPVNSDKGSKKGKQKATQSKQTTTHKLTITIPPKNMPPIAQSMMDADPNVQLYCTCRGPSEGGMIMCDAEGCPIEWYHMLCIGMKAAPPENSKWYCDTCIKSGASKKKKRSRK